MMCFEEGFGSSDMGDSMNDRRSSNQILHTNLFPSRRQTSLLRSTTPVTKETSRRQLPRRRQLPPRMLPPRRIAARLATLTTTATPREAADLVRLLAMASVSTIAARELAAAKRSRRAGAELATGDPTRTTPRRPRDPSSKARRTTRRLRRSEPWRLKSKRRRRRKRTTK